MYDNIDDGLRALYTNGGLARVRFEKCIKCCTARTDYGKPCDVSGGGGEVI